MLDNVTGYYGRVVRRPGFLQRQVGEGYMARSFLDFYDDVGVFDGITLGMTVKSLTRADVGERLKSYSRRKAEPFPLLIKAKEIARSLGLLKEKKRFSLMVD